MVLIVPNQNGSSRPYVELRLKVRWGIPARHSDAKVSFRESASKCEYEYENEYLALSNERVFIVPNVGPRSPLLGHDEAQ